MSIYASWITARLGYRLGPFAEQQALGTVVLEALFILDAERDLRRRPDLAFVSADAGPSAWRYRKPAIGRSSPIWPWKW